MKVAVVVQRYGAEINGGAELHARYIAEHLSRLAEVQVFTTCARDYITWKNEYAPGADTIGGVRVVRFPVSHPREPRAFGRHSARVFDEVHSIGDELAWLESEGPASPALVRHVARSAGAIDWYLFFSYRYYHAYHGARAVPSKAVLVPTAERDDAAGVEIFSPVFRGVRGLMYNSLEERALIHAVSGNQDVPGTVVGVGSAIPDHPQAGRFRRKHNIRRPFAIYVGRIDENKGCREMFAHFQRYAAAHPRGLDLVLIGNAVIPVPDHPRITHLGFLPDQDKFDALAASDLLIMPSFYESLSMVALEAWALGKPVLVNGRCDVLKGQTLRSTGGLYYDTAEEFAEAVYMLEGAGPVNAILGRNGREYFKRNYAWPVIERKYMDMFERLAREPARPMAPLPGWFSRRKRVLQPAAARVAAVPAGPQAESRGPRA
ncbi:MAG TPA: glycosyltransferase family 4 protein [Vicinamibacterales bacterium]|nr:glycosyltransferase family 4 protein [Vicinamibacterales bacterium]